jgi:hypothetical protein
MYDIIFYLNIKMDVNCKVTGEWKEKRRWIFPGRDFITGKSLKFSTSSKIPKSFFIGKLLFWL